MFWNKKGKNVYCSNCGVILLKDKAKKVKFISPNPYSPDEYFYCHHCSPNYNEVILSKGKYYYWKNVVIEVDREGNPIKKPTEIKKEKITPPPANFGNRYLSKNGKYYKNHQQYAVLKRFGRA